MFSVSPLNASLTELESAAVDASYSDSTNTSSSHAFLDGSGNSINIRDYRFFVLTLLAGDNLKASNIYPTSMYQSGKTIEVACPVSSGGSVALRSASFVYVNDTGCFLYVSNAGYQVHLYFIK